ncbi:putative phage holin [Streptomyces sp. NPDC002308]
MSFAQILNLAASALVALFSAVFVIAYHVLAPWRRTFMGWHLMLFTGAIGCLGLYTVVVTITGLDGLPAMILRYIRSALLILVAALIVQRTWMVWTAQAHPPTRRKLPATGSRTGDDR